MVNAGAGKSELTPDQIVHEFDEDQNHRLIVNGDPGLWVPFNTVAQQEVFHAITSFFNGSGLPEVFIALKEPFSVLAASGKADA